MSRGGATLLVVLASRLPLADHRPHAREQARRLREQFGVFSP